VRHARTCCALALLRRIANLLLAAKTGALRLVTGTNAMYLLLIELPNPPPRDGQEVPRVRDDDYELSCLATEGAYWL
jgi:hypothetical protein